MASAIFWLSGLYWPEVTFCCSAETRFTRTSGTLAKLALRLCRSLCLAEMLTVSSPAAGLAPAVLADLIAKDEYVRDLLVSMDTITDISLDPELLYIVRGFVETNGVSHLGAITRNDIAADWSNRKFWTETALLNKLTSENPQTETYVLYGLHSALPDWRTVEFLTNKAGLSWKEAAQVVGYRTMVRDGVTVMGYSAEQ